MRSEFEGLAKADARWERFAQRDPMFYICTTLDRDEFFSSGERVIADLFHKYGGLLSGDECALEIGCGVGRLTIPLASRFRHVTAVDISPTMLQKLAANCSRLGLTNVEGIPSFSADWIRTSYYDLAMSLLTFQHIEEWAVIQEYIVAVFRSLRPGGIAFLQFDTRPRALAYRLRGLVPDLFLPKTQRKGIRRIRSSREELLALFSQVGFCLLGNEGQRSDFEVFIVSKASSSPPTEIGGRDGKRDLEQAGLNEQPGAGSSGEK